MEDGCQEDGLARAQAAAAAGDGWGTVEALLSSPVLDGLVRRLRWKWPRLPAADVDEAVAAAVDDLYTAIRQGKRVGNLVAWLFKVADRKAGRLHRQRVEEELRDPDDMADDPRLFTVDRDWGAASAEEQDAVTKEVVGIARTLLRRFPPGNTVKVMEVYINAAELGISHLETSEVAAIVGLDPETVRVLTWRGFQRMERLAHEAGLVSPQFELRELLPETDTDPADPDDDDGR